MKSQHLYDLIQALNKAEKRYIKLSISVQKGEKDYLKVFDAYDSLGDHVEDPDDAILKRLNDKRFAKRISSIKNYLYGQLLKSLRNYHSGKNTDSELRGLMEDVIILFDKRLYTQALKQLQRAQKLALERERFLALEEILGWEIRINKEELEPTKFVAFLEQAHLELNKYSELRHKVNELYYLFNKIIAINRRIKHARSESEVNEFKAVMDHELLANEDDIETVEAKLYYYLIHLTYAFSTGDYSKCLEYARKEQALFEEHDYLISERPDTYVSAITNMLLAQLHMHDYRGYPGLINKLRGLDNLSLGKQVQVFVSSYIHEMVMYSDTGQFSKGILMAPAMLEGIERHGEKITIPEQVILYFNLAYLYFGSGNHKESLKYVNLLLNEFGDDLRYDVHCACRIMALILHFEMKKIVLIDYVAKSAKRYLGKSDRNFKMEKVILDFMQKNIHKINYRSDRIVEFEKLREQCEELHQDEFEKPAFDYFDYFAWIDSKIQDRPFGELVQERFEGKLP